jgi:large subunit ribosomal protein L22
LEIYGKMPKWGYSITEGELDAERTVKASGRELRVSPKSAREVCKEIKGKYLNHAKRYLRAVVIQKVPVPFKRHAKKVGHRHALNKACAGRYPEKAAKYLIKILEGAEANAEYKGLDAERLRIVHASAYPGIKIKRYMPRAFGRASPKFETLCHIEICLEEQPETEMKV